MIPFSDEFQALRPSILPEAKTTDSIEEKGKVEIPADSKKVVANSSEPIGRPKESPDPEISISIPKDSPTTSVPKPPAKSLTSRIPAKAATKSALKPPATKVSKQNEPKVGQNVTLVGGRKGIIRYVGFLAGSMKKLFGLN